MNKKFKVTVADGVSLTMAANEAKLTAVEGESYSTLKFARVGATYTWTGASNEPQYWTRSGNWTVDGETAPYYPDAGNDKVVFPEGEGKLEVSMTQKAYTDTITFNRDVALTSSDDTNLYVNDIKGTGTLTASNLNLRNNSGKNMTVGVPLAIPEGKTLHYTSASASNGVTIEKSISGKGTFEANQDSTEKRAYVVFGPVCDASGFEGVFKVINYVTTAHRDQTQFKAAKTMSASASYTVWGCDDTTDMFASDTTYSIGALNGTLTRTSSANVSLTIGNRNEDCTLVGADSIGDAGWTITKVGSKTMNYSGDQPASFVLNGGTLVVKLASDVTAVEPNTTVSGYAVDTATSVDEKAKTTTYTYTIAPYAVKVNDENCTLAKMASTLKRGDTVTILDGTTLAEVNAALPATRQLKANGTDPETYTAQVKLNAPSSIRVRGFGNAYVMASQSTAESGLVPTIKYTIDDGEVQTANEGTSCNITFSEDQTVKITAWAEKDEENYITSDSITYTTVPHATPEGFTVRKSMDFAAKTHGSIASGKQYCGYGDTAETFEGVILKSNDGKTTSPCDFYTLKFLGEEVDSDFVFRKIMNDSLSRWEASHDAGLLANNVGALVAVKNCKAGDVLYINASSVKLPPVKGTYYCDASAMAAGSSNLAAADGYTNANDEYWYTVQKDGPVFFMIDGKERVYAIRAYHKMTATEKFTADVAAVEAGTKNSITLIGNVELTETAVFTKDVEINLAGHTITATDCRAIWVKSGEVTITGTGTITSVKPENGKLADSSSVIRVGDGAATAAIAKLTIDSGVTISAPATYGVTVFGKNTTTESVNPIQLVMNGTISAGGAAGISGNGSSGLSATTITVGGSVTSTVDAGIYLPGAGICTIGASATVTGPTGIAVKGGKLVVTDGAKITATGEKTAFVHNGDGWNSTGDAIAIEATPDYPANTWISVATPASYTIGTYAQPGKDVTVVGTKNSDGTTTYGVQATTAATTVPDTVTEVVIQPGATVKAESATESAGKTLAGKIVVKYGSTDLTEYMNKTVATDGTVSIALKAKTDLTTEQKAKVVPAATAMAMPQESSTDQVSFTIGNPVEGLFYSVVAADSVAGLDSAAVPTGTQYQGGSSMTVTSATLPSDSNVKYYKVSVKATK